MGLHVGQCHVHRRTSSGGLRKRSDAALSGLCTFFRKRTPLHARQLLRKGTWSPSTGQRWLSVIPISPGKFLFPVRLLQAPIRDITFDGSHSVTLAAGASAASDALSFPVSAGQTLCVSLYFDGYTSMQSAVLITGPLSRWLFSYRRPDAQRSAAPCHLQGDKLVLFS